MLFLLLACNSQNASEESQSIQEGLSMEELGFAVEEASLALLSINPQIHHDAWKEAMDNPASQKCVYDNEQ